MIWRILAFIATASCAALIGRKYGYEAGQGVFSGLTALMLALSEIERRLAAILKEMKP